MHNLKVIKITEEYILFEEGFKLYSEHEQDCCENHYLSFSDLTLEDFDGLSFDLTTDTFFKRIEDYGLFVELPKKKMGLCHISNLGERYSTPLTAHFKLGQIIRVKIKGIDPDGKVAVTKI